MPFFHQRRKTNEAIVIATKVINALKLKGLLAVEMFVDTSGKIWVNESAPRTHNSGHHTIESNGYIAV
ncbi:MAG: ATP-grasp domain-containing protein [Bacteroidales bacterium]